MTADEKLAIALAAYRDADEALQSARITLRIAAGRVAKLRLAERGIKKGDECLCDHAGLASVGFRNPPYELPVRGWIDVEVGESGVVSYVLLPKPLSRARTFIAYVPVESLRPVKTEATP